MRRLLLLVAIALCSCHHVTQQSRVVRLLVAADPVFRARPNWRDLIASRVRAVSEIYSPFGIGLEVADVSEWNPNPKLSLEQKRRGLSGFNSDGNAIFLGIAAPPPGDSLEPGLAVAFDARLLVFDFPSKTEEQNQALLTHELAHVFAAWHSPESSSVLHLPPGSSFDSNARESIQLTRAMDFRTGMAGLSRETLDRVEKLWSASKSDPGLNPLLDADMHTALELLNMGHAEEGIEALARALELSPGNVNAHYMLASAELSLRHYAAAAGEFHKVVELSPRNVSAWNSLGGALMQNGQSAEAIPAFRKALEMDASNQTIRANVAAALVRTPGHLEEGISELREVLRGSPNEENLKIALTAALQAKQNGRK